jgi:signal transduction histidine kinase
VAIYKVLTNELDRVERIQRIRQDHQLSLPDNPFDITLGSPRVFRLDPQLVEETKDRLQIILILINLGILGASSLAGYFLAGRTLRPIKEMVDEQNRFVTDASHELRTPLTSLKTATEVYLRDKNHTLEESDDLHKSNLEEINNLQTLSDNLIKLTQYQKANGNMVFADASLTDIVEEAVKKVSNLSKYKKITLLNKVKDVKIEADRQSLAEMFVVIFDNAIKYSPKNTKVTMSSSIQDRFVVIEIKDEGMGIDEKDIPHLFDRFYRVDKSRTKTDVAGYGLGLSIAKQIVDKHHGHIKIESEVGKGTTFAIQLPYAKQK